MELFFIIGVFPSARAAAEHGQHGSQSYDEEHFEQVRVVFNPDETDDPPEDEDYPQSDGTSSWSPPTHRRRSASPRREQSVSKRTRSGTFSDGAVFGSPKRVREEVAGDDDDEPAAAYRCIQALERDTLKSWNTHCEKYGIPPNKSVFVLGASLDAEEVIAARRRDAVVD